MQLEAILHTLQDMFPAEISEPRLVPIGETFVTLPADRILDAVRSLVEQLGVCHLSTITGQDTGDEIELLYHFWLGRGLTLRTSLPRRDAHIGSVTSLIPGAAFYEREVHEMLGVIFDGLANPDPLLLPDDWSGEHPLLTDQVEEETA